MDVLEWQAALLQTIKQIFDTGEDDVYRSTQTYDKLIGNFLESLARKRTKGNLVEKIERENSLNIAFGVCFHKRNFEICKLSIGFMVVHPGSDRIQIPTSMRLSPVIKNPFIFHDIKCSSFGCNVAGTKYTFSQFFQTVPNMSSRLSAFT